MKIPYVTDQCFFRGKSYDHGETEAMPECAYCECMDGSMQCKKGDSKNCPPLSCPPSQQIVVPGECCKVCPGEFFIYFPITKNKILHPTYSYIQIPHINAFHMFLEENFHPVKQVP